MNSKIIYIIIFFSLVSFQCKEKKELDENIIVQQNENQKMIENILEKQLKQGISQYALDEEGNSISEAIKHSFSEEDLEVSVDIVSQLLKSNGYKQQNNDFFIKRVFSIFGRLLDLNSQNKYIYIDFLDKCNRKMILYPNDNINFKGLFIVKNENFITPFYYLPELINYQDKYPEIAKKEKSFPEIWYNDELKMNLDVEKWMNLSDLTGDYNLSQRRYFNQQLLIHRNKYLFNDHKVSLVWLKANDTDFLESLVTTFGYTEDADLVAWVMKRNQDKAEQFLKENLFVKNCKGELEIRKGILKYIGTHTNEDEKTQQYAQALHRFDYEDKKWSKNERFKIIAYIGSTFDELFKKSETLGNTSKGRISFLGTVFVKSLHEDNEKTWQELEKNFKENNYYNLPNLKQLTSDAVEFESFPVRGSRWEE